MAEHVSKVVDEIVSLYPDASVAEIAPPFADEHDVNVAPDIVSAPENELNSNTPPFPLSLLINLNVFVPLILTAPPFAEISAFDVVVYPLAPVNEMLIVLSVIVPLDVTEIRQFSPLNCDVIVIAKY